MPNLSNLVGHWGYWAIFLLVVAGNLGVPVPEETVLTLSGYFVWKKELWLPAVLAIGTLSAITGDNLGYWAGRLYGKRFIESSADRVWVQAKKFDRMQRLFARFGAITVFLARFLPGLRFMAGPIAGSLGMRFLKFFVANALGAALYVPLAVTAGYAVGYGFGGWIGQLRDAVEEVEHVALAGVIILVVLILGLKAFRTRIRHHLPEQ